MSKKEDQELILLLIKYASKNKNFKLDNGTFAICCDIFTNHVEFYYLDEDAISYRDTVLGYCDSLKDVNLIIDELSDLMPYQESKKSIKESINGDCYIYYDDDDGKRNVFCDYVKGITDTRNWFYLDEYIIDAIHIFKNEKQAQKFIDEHLKYFADQDKVVIAEYPQTVSGFFESKESVRKSIEESLDIDQFTNLFLDTFSVIFLFSQRKNIKKALGYKENESIIKTLIINVKKALEEMNDDGTIN